jgi:hypothetical protein
MLGAQFWWMAQRRSRPWNRGDLDCLLIGSSKAGRSAGVGHWTRHCAGVPDSPTRVHHSSGQPAFHAARHLRD